MKLESLHSGKTHRAKNLKMTAQSAPDELFLTRLFSAMKTGSRCIITVESDDGIATWSKERDETNEDQTDSPENHQG